MAVTSATSWILNSFSRGSALTLVILSAICISTPWANFPERVWPLATHVDASALWSGRHVKPAGWARNFRRTNRESEVTPSVASGNFQGASDIRSASLSCFVPRLRGGRRFDSDEEETFRMDGRITLKDILGAPLDELCEKERKEEEEAEGFRVPEGEKMMRDGWYDDPDSDSAYDEAVEEWYNVTSSLGEPPHGSMWMLFNGTQFRNPNMYKHPDETDEEMIWRHYLGHTNDSTLAGLHRLKIASIYGDTREIRELVEEGVDVNGNLDDWSHEKAVHYAAWHGQLAALELLLELGADPDARNYYRQSAVHRAAAGGYTEACALLIKRGATAIDTDRMNYSAPEWAAEMSLNETCQWFYANFVSPLPFPQGPAPHYGLPVNEGYEHFAPMPSGQNATDRLFMDSGILEKDAFNASEDAVKEALMQEAARRYEFEQALAEQGQG